MACSSLCAYDRPPRSLAPSVAGGVSAASLDAPSSTSRIGAVLLVGALGFVLWRIWRGSR
jgi:hypothetical protein